MTRRTICLTDVSTVIKNRIMTFEFGKFFHPASLRICMADGADRVLFVFKLLDMTTRTRQMFRGFQGCRIVIAFVTKKTGEPFMLTNRMGELRKISIRVDGHQRRLRRKRRFSRSVLRGPVIVRTGNQQVTIQTKREKNDDYFRYLTCRIGDSCFFRSLLHKRFLLSRDSLGMGLRNRHPPERQMTFHAFEIRILPSLIDLVIQNSSVVRSGRDMTWAARKDIDLLGFEIDRCHLFHIVTGGTFEILMTLEFVPERGRRITSAPGGQHDLITDLHWPRDLCIKITFRLICF